MERVAMTIVPFLTDNVFETPVVPALVISTKTGRAAVRF
jgi:hypothetical protein